MSVEQFLAWPHAIDWEIEKCRYVTERPQWYPRIIWGASLDGASYVLSIPLLWRSFSSVQMFHTHTPPSGDQSWGPDSEVKMRMKREMKMRWKWRWNECYLTGTRDGERKKGEEEPGEKTNTNTPCPERANPEKARKKKKRRPTEEHQDKRRGGKDGRAWTNLTPAKTKPTWAHTEPDLPGEGEHAWNRGPMGT